MESYRLISEAMGKYIKPPPRAKFQNGERVKITGEESPERFRQYHGKKRLGLIGKEGTIAGYDYYPGSYSKFLVKFDDGTKDGVHSHFLIPAQPEGRLSLIDKVLKLGVPDYHPGMQTMGNAYLNQLKKFGYEPATENDLQDFKKNLLKSSPFQNNLSKGIKSVKSLYNENNFHLNLIGVMRLYPHASSANIMTNSNDECMPVFDRNKPVFYFWHASPNFAIYKNMKDSFVISFPVIVGYPPDATFNSIKLTNLDQNFHEVKTVDGDVLDSVLRGVEILSSGKKLRSDFDYREDALCLYRIATTQSIKAYKGVQQQDFDAIMGL